MKNTLFAVAFALLTAPMPAGAAPQIIESKLFEVGKTAGEPLFTQSTRLEDQPDGTVKSTAEIKDATGTVVMTEEAYLKGGEILSQKMEQRQINEAYELAQENGELIFRTFSLAEGKRTLTEEKKEKRPENFVTGPSLQPFLKPQMAAFKEGKDLTVNFGIFEVSRSIAFELAPKEVADGKVTVRMKADSFFVSMFVAPIYLSFDLSSGRLVGFKGRTPLRKMVNGNLKPFDAEITYSFLSGHAASK